LRIYARCRPQRDAATLPCSAAPTRSLRGLRRPEADVHGPKARRHSEPMLVVVIFALVANRSNHDFALADDSKQRYIA
jgi:hypothetical protein